MPRIEHFEQGDAWVMEGALDAINFGTQLLRRAARRAALAVDPLGRGPRRAGTTPRPRIMEQDHDGVDAEILYPTPRVVGTRSSGT